MVMKANENRKGRTITFHKKNTPNAAKWVLWLEENCLASAGPYANLKGMRQSYWGKEALVVKAGTYLYLMGREDDGRDMPW